MLSKEGLYYNTTNVTNRNVILLFKLLELQRKRNPQRKREQDMNGNGNDTEKENLSEIGSLKKLLAFAKKYICTTYSYCIFYIVSVYHCYNVNFNFNCIHLQY